MKEQFEVFKFRQGTLKTIAQANDIIKEYSLKGFSLTLRQIYYQFVSRDFIPNTEKSYKNIGSIINNGRLAGLIDWQSIIDRTRNLRGNTHWNSPGEIIESAAGSFKMDKWENQDNYIEVWIEKDALIGVISQVCSNLDINYFSCRGYVSQSEMWRASKRIKVNESNGKACYIIHLGDHDPSGIDMTRDIQDRLRLFGTEIDVKRIALNMKQVEKYKPPPNPAKISDSRFINYMNKYGSESWELDALSPEVISKLIEKNIKIFRDVTRWELAADIERGYRDTLVDLAENWRDYTDKKNDDE